ncbi:MAG: hypothetical protein AAGJ46_04870 [Planctomycetota bacterium]
MKRFTALAVASAALLLLVAAGPRVRGLLWVSSEVAALALAIALPLGGLLAFLLVKTDVWGRVTAGWLLASMLFMPLYLQAAGWEAACGQLGWWTQAVAAGGPARPLFAGVLGAGLVHGLAATPWVALIAGAALRCIDREEEEAALLDASPPAVLLRVTSRHAAAGLAVGALWVAVTVSAEMTVTDLLQVRTFAEEVYTQAVIGAFDPRSDVPASLGPRGLAAGISLIALLGAAAIGGVRPWVVKGMAMTGAGWRWRMRSRVTRSTAAVLLWASVGLLLAAPVASLATQAGVTVERVGDSWRRGWSAPKLVSAVVTSPWIHREDVATSAGLGVMVATGAVAVGLGWAWRMSCSRRPPLVSLAGLAICLVMPGPLLGVACIGLMNHPWDSPFAPLTWLYDHTLAAPWLVQMVRATPIATLVLWPALASVPNSLLDAAKAEGAGPLRRLLMVAAPMRLRALAAAWVAALAVSVGELSATKLVLPPGWTTVAERVFTLLHYGVEDRVAGLSLAMIGFFLACAAVAAAVLRAGTSSGPSRR